MTSADVTSRRTRLLVGSTRRSSTSSRRSWPGSTSAGVGVVVVWWWWGCGGGVQVGETIVVVSAHIQTAAVSVVLAALPVRRFQWPDTPSCTQCGVKHCEPGWVAAPSTPAHHISQLRICPYIPFIVVLLTEDLPQAAGCCCCRCSSPPPSPYTIPCMPSASCVSS
jgi:hypothetical protein